QGGLHPSERSLGISVIEMRADGYRIQPQFARGAAVRSQRPPRGGHAMSSRLWRSLVLTTLLALLLALSGAAAPTGAAVPIGPVGNPQNTKVAGVDVDATT